MNGLEKLVIVSMVSMLASTQAIRAAENLPEPAVVELPAEEPFDGWYLRGDVSMDMVDNFGATYVGNSYTASKLDTGYNIGVGVGYQVNEFFRSDLTLERFGSDFSGATAGSCAFDALGAPIVGSCTSVESAKFSAWSLMANGYFEFGNFIGFTPYVGAGLGASYVSWKNYQSVDTCTRTDVATTSCFPGAAAFVAPGAGGTATTRTTAFDGDKSWKFSYALMAGFSYDISENLKLDAGYKYTSIATGALINDIGGGASVDHDAIGVHAIRVGLRYLVW